MRLLTKTKSLAAVGFLAFLPLTGFAQTAAPSADLVNLQAQVDNYLSPAMVNEIDSLLSSYTTLGLGQTYTAASPGLVSVADGMDATWSKMTYSDASASQLIGYAKDQCVSHTTYDQLVAKGVKLDQAKFNSTRDKFCKLVKAAAELKHRYDKYQAIKANGVTLAKREKSQGHDFKDRHRTFAGGFDLVYYPDVANTLKTGLHPDHQLQYNSWMKWSDDGKQPLNLLKKLRDQRNDKAGKCDGVSLHIIDGKEVDGWFYLDVVNVTSSKLTIKNCMKADYNKTHKTHGFPEFSVEAPFGYLYELEQMKDSAKVQLKDKIKTKVVSMVGANEQMVALLQKLK
ncbi:hypothetical protein [Limnobacter parvus]|uniref:Uncharacterized protein n=1 Tax=Limnobacter parvus TaxID=2939690 RepID=A0ABT1XPB0_9BURK|nr:hypothetical protein [Limnobacter parvus]MCR2747934.1 hypothetical protein [Limnobacter parvus]